jgi:hypothetical protein
MVEVDSATSVELFLTAIIRDPQDSGTDPSYGRIRSTLVMNGCLFVNVAAHSLLSSHGELLQQVP